jgi:hypothetical protein
MSEPQRAAGEPLLPDLDEYRMQTERIREDAASLFADLSDVQANWRPPPGGWSIVQCVDHLNRTGKLYLKPIDGAIREARAKGWLTQRPSRRGLIGDVLVRSQEPPPRLSLPAPEMIVPGSEQPLALVAESFLALQDRIVERLHSANGLDLRRARVTSPILSLLKMNLSTAIGFLLAHERRHVWQAWQVRKHAEFPAA